VNDNDFALWKREISEQFEREGLRVEQLELDANGLKLEAKYVQ
jgi:hypothetical protein